MNPNFNSDKQHTLKEEVTISGTGLHTGVMADLTLKPASPGFGLQFKRIDLPAQPCIGCFSRYGY
jgi:UDP-3-O-[3-hydroxymyristoyl] N-acetylglucosamine deacetylase / 3-hydroxyacyl-[acyl-carrier-protein] dehydratase